MAHWMTHRCAIAFALAAGLEGFTTGNMAGRYHLLGVAERGVQGSRPPPYLQQDPHLGRRKHGHAYQQQRCSYSHGLLPTPHRAQASQATVPVSLTP